MQGDLTGIFSLSVSQNIEYNDLKKAKKKSQNMSLFNYIEIFLGDGWSF